MSSAFEAYERSLSEIPTTPVTDQELAIKKLGLHRRQFVGEAKKERDWFRRHRAQLIAAYGGCLR